MSVNLRKKQEILTLAIGYNTSIKFSVFLISTTVESATL